jgi:hypothetical protein
MAAGACFGSPTIYTGSLSASADGGLTAYGAWDSPCTTLSWTVDNTTTQGLWHYNYMLTVPTKDISHIIIEASNGDNPFTTDNLFSSGSSPSDWIDSIEVGMFTPDGSTPYMPESIYGIKFDADSDSTFVTISFDSDRAPVWGDFYSKDGITPGGDWCAVYNSGFALADPLLPAANGSLQGHLLVPDSYIPAPGAIVLVCIGTVLTGRMRRRKMI